MKDAVEPLKDSPRVAAASTTTSRRSKDDRGFHLGHPPPREKLSLRDGDEASMEIERKSKRTEKLGVCEPRRG